MSKIIVKGIKRTKKREDDMRGGFIVVLLTSRKSLIKIEKHEEVQHRNIN